jgi:hypothetical protein
MQVDFICHAVARQIKYYSFGVTKEARVAMICLDAQED